MSNDSHSRGETGATEAVPEHTEELTFPFRFTTAYRRLGRPFGINARSARVSVVDSTFEARFGPWRITTPLANIAGTTSTGPYRLHRTAGPAHYSFADHGLTFASNGDRGLCIEFHEPVTGIEPTRALRHPNLTVTVADVDGLDRVLAPHTAGTLPPESPTDADRALDEQLKSSFPSSDAPSGWAGPPT